MKLTEKVFWDDIYSTRPGCFYPNPRKYRLHFELVSLFKKYLPDRKGLKLIEIGCGGSIWLPYFCKEFGYDVYGIDYSKKGCKLAEMNLTKMGCEGELFCKDILDLDNGFYSQFDIVISLGVIEHFSKSPEIIEIFSNLLKKEGIIITVVPNFKGIMGVIARYIDKRIYQMHTIFTLRELEDYHKRRSFKNIYSSYMDFFDMGMINLSKFSIWIQRLIGRLFVTINLPILYLCKVSGLDISSQKICSYMIFIGRKT